MQEVRFVPASFISKAVELKYPMCDPKITSNIRLVTRANIEVAHILNAFTRDGMFCPTFRDQTHYSCRTNLNAIIPLFNLVETASYIHWKTVCSVNLLLGSMSKL